MPKFMDYNPFLNPTGITGGRLATIIKFGIFQFRLGVNKLAFKKRSRAIQKIRVKLNLSILLLLIGDIMAY